MAREYETLNEALNAVDDEVSAQSDKIEDILEALKGKAGGGGLEKIGTAITNPTGYDYGRIEVPVTNGEFLICNPTIAPSDSNRIPFSLILKISADLNLKGCVGMGYNHGGYSYNPVFITVDTDKTMVVGQSAIRFNAGASYDVYRIN